MAEKQRNKSIRLTHAEYYKGPLPHPEIVAKFEQTLPGAANRILLITEKQATHRLKMEKELVSASLKNETRGLHYSFIITMSLIGIGAFLIYVGKDVIGFITLFGPSIFHAGNYIYKKSQEQKILREQEKEMKREEKVQKSLKNK